MTNKSIQPLLEKVFQKSGLGKWFNKESAGGGPGWIDITLKERGSESAVMLKKAKLIPLA